jgi:hypothetical protein
VRGLRWWNAAPTGPDGAGARRRARAVRPTARRSGTRLGGRPSRDREGAAKRPLANARGSASRHRSPSRRSARPKSFAPMRRSERWRQGSAWRSLAIRAATVRERFPPRTGRSVTVAARIGRQRSPSMRSASAKRFLSFRAVARLRMAASSKVPRLACPAVATVGEPTVALCDPPQEVAERFGASVATVEVAEEEGEQRVGLSGRHGLGVVLEDPSEGPRACRSRLRPRGV